MKYGYVRVSSRRQEKNNSLSEQTAAIKEMYRQVGDLVIDSEGIAQRGVIVRHLIFPDYLAGSEESLTWLAREVSPTVTLSVMAQYYPAHKAYNFPQLTRTITEREYDEVVELLNRLGIDNGWVQEMDAHENYRPDFKREKSPFLD